LGRCPRDRQEMRVARPTSHAVGVQIRLLGQFRLQVRGTLLDVPPGRLQALLACLALQAGSPVPRAQVAARLWPDSPDESARATLRKWLHQLRSLLPDLVPFLDLEGASLRWRGEPDTVDVLRFEACVHGRDLASLRRAMALYQGEFLPGCYDEWAAVERQRLAELHVAGLERLAHLLEQAGDLSEGVAVLQRLIRHDPLHEGAYRHLMHLQERQGDLSAGLRTYASCARILERELGVAPSPATRDMYERMRAALLVERRSQARVAGQADMTALDAVEDDLFVGRKRELELFRRWCAQGGEPLEVLNVHGPGGTGKSALLHAFAREARRAGRSVVTLDGQAIAATPEGFAAALGVARPTDAAPAFNATGPVVLLDAYDEIIRLGRWLQQDFLPRLSPVVRLVIASRNPVSRLWGPGSPWVRCLRPLPLRGVTPAEAREYLRRRGVDTSAEAEAVLAAAAGLPLALALAADLVLQVGVRRLEGAPAWREAVHTLVRQLTREVRDQRLGRMLEACAIVRQFDEDLLAALLPEGDVAAAFQQLCGLSFVQPAAHGLRLHDEVRRFLAEDLRWRAPGRYADLRRRAMEVYGQRWRAAPAAEQAWLFPERLYLWNDALVQALLFPPLDASVLWLDEGGLESQAELLALWRDWSVRVAGRSQPVAAAERLLDAELGHPDRRLRVVRDAEGTATGFSCFLPVDERTLPLLADNAMTAGLVRYLLDRGPLGGRRFHFSFIAWSERQPELTQASLLVDAVELLAGGGFYYASTAAATLKAFVTRLGFVRLPVPPTPEFTTPAPLEHFELDIAHPGFEVWVERLLAAT
jgi:DNA-binding SARP family transcriptional activator